MPYINLKLTAGVQRHEKEQIVQEFTAVLQRILDKNPHETHIIIEEIEQENWGLAGMLVDDYRRQR